MSPRRGWAFAALVYGLALGTACEAPAPTEPPPRPIAWTQVKPLDHAHQRILPGVVQAAESAPLAFEVGGRVTAVNVEIGERFERGDVLARLDDHRYQLAVDESRGALADARARLAEARKTLARKRELRAREVGSQAAVDQAQAAFGSVAGQVERLQARTARAEQDLADTRLVAPYAGEVLQREVEPAQQVAAGQTVFSVQGQSAGLEVAVNAPETVIDGLELGSRQRVRFPARPQLDMQATVTEIGAGATRRNAFPVMLALTDAPPTVRPGMTAEVTLSLTDALADALADAPADAPAQAAQSEQAGNGGNNAPIAIPASAFLAVAGQQRVVFVYDPDGERVNRRNVTITTIAGGQALVADGLSAGEIIATKGLSFLEDGQPVTLLGRGPRRYLQ